VAVTQIGSATASESAATSARLVRLEIERLRQDAKTRERLLNELTARVASEAARFSAGLKTLGEVDAGMRSDLTQASGEQTRQAEASNAAQQETAARVARLTEEIGALRTEVVPRETKVLQDQLAACRQRQEQTEKDVSALGQALGEAGVPGLEAKVQALDRRIAQLDTDLRALARTSESFQGQMTRTTEAIGAQVAELFKSVFYNDPRGKLAPPGPAQPSP
jgi:chromosome segregation ATPase